MFRTQELHNSYKFTHTTFELVHILAFQLLYFLEENYMYSKVYIATDDLIIADNKLSYSLSLLQQCCAKQRKLRPYVGFTVFVCDDNS